MTFPQGIVLVSYAVVSAWPMAAYAKGKNPMKTAIIAAMTGVALIILDWLTR